MQNHHLPTPTSTLRVDISGAEILDDHPQSVETSDIYLPKHTEYISHIAVDIGGSLAKIVYFTRATSDHASTSTTTTRLPVASSSSSDPELVRNASDANFPTTHVEHCKAGKLTIDSIECGDSSTARVETATLPTKTPSSQPNGILNPKLVRDEAGHRNRPLISTTIDPASSLAQAQHNPPTQPTHSSSPVVSSGKTTDRPRPPPRSAARSSVSSIPGGRLNFTKFETEAIETECIPFISNLIEISAASNGVSIETMKRGVKIILTGGGAHVYSDRIREALGGDVEVLKEEEMDCLITGLNFITEIPNEVFWFSDELVQEIVHNTPHGTREKQDALKTSTRTTLAIHQTNSDSILSPQPGEKNELPRPSPNPPQYSVLFDAHPTPQFPCMLVNIGSGVSIIKVSAYGEFERISGTSLGGGTLWGLLSLLTQAKSFDEMLDLSMLGDNSKVDMLVGDIYGQDYQKIGLKSSVIASSFGKVFKKGQKHSSGSGGGGGVGSDHQKKEAFKAEDISKSLLYAISNNIGQIAHLNAEQHGLDRIYFGGCFIRGHAATVSTLSYAIRFWSKGTKRAFFLRHEGYLGSIGAWLKNLDEDSSNVQQI